MHKCYLCGKETDPDKDSIVHLNPVHWAELVKDSPMHFCNPGCSSIWFEQTRASLLKGK